MSLFGPPNVEKLKAKGNIKGLIKALDYQKDLDVRKAAAKALGQLGNKQAREALVSVLNDSERLVRIAAISALGQTGNWREIEPLIKDSDEGVRLTVAETLGQIGDGQAIKSLMSALKDDKSWRVREAAAQSLENLGWQPEKNETGVLYWIAKQQWDKCIEIGKLAVKPLISILMDYFMGYDINVRTGVVKTLGQIGDKQAVESLSSALNDRDMNVQIAAAEALGQIGDKQAVESLISSLEDYEYEEVRFTAANALGRIGGDRAIAVLITMLEDEDRNVCEIAAQSLENQGWQPDKDETGAFYWIAKQQWDKCIEIGKPAVQPLISILMGYYDTAVYIAVIEALEQIGDEQAIESLLRTLDSRYKDVRIAGIKALGQTGNEQGVESLISSLKDSESEARSAAAKALGQIGSDRAIADLIATLEDEDRDVRETAAQSLENLDWQPEKDKIGARYWIIKQQWEKCVEIGSPSVGLLITSLSATEDKKMRQSAIAALGQIDDWRAVRLLINALEDKDANVRITAAKALGQIKAEGAIDPLIHALKDDEDGVRSTAIEALVAIGVPAAGPLGDCLRSEDKSLREGAMSTLVAIGAPAVEILLSCLHRAGGQMKIAILDIFTRIGEPAIKPLLKKYSWEFYSRVNTALVAIGTAAIEPLVTLLGGKDALNEYGECENIAGVLAKLGWQPDESKAGVNYWIAKRQLKRCVPLGGIAAKPLIAQLTGAPSSNVRKDAASALVKIYGTEKLDDEYKRLVLEYRDVITSPHVDNPATHTDYETHRDTKHTDEIERVTGSSDCYHEHADFGPFVGKEHHDGEHHTDEGLGVDFPL